MAELYRVRGATNMGDVQEKLLLPQVLDCTIHQVNKTFAKDLVAEDKRVIKEIKDCVTPRVEKYHIVVDDVLNWGFGPSVEARVSMKAFADASQRGQVADVELSTARKRAEAANINAEISAKTYNTYIEKEIPKEQIPVLLCLSDVTGQQRPCIPYTASGNSTFSMMPAAASPSSPQ